MDVQSANPLNTHMFPKLLKFSEPIQLLRRWSLWKLRSHEFFDPVISMLKLVWTSENSQKHIISIIVQKIIFYIRLKNISREIFLNGTIHNQKAKSYLFYTNQTVTYTATSDCHQVENSPIKSSTLKSCKSNKSKRKRHWSSIISFAKPSHVKRGLIYILPIIVCSLC